MSAALIFFLLGRLGTQICYMDVASFTMVSSFSHTDLLIICHFPGNYGG